MDKKTPKKTINTEPKKSKVVKPINMNSYVRPNRRDLYYYGTEYLLNGVDNKYYNFLEDKYSGSKTNTAVIDAIVKYIYGEGIMNNGQPIKNIISNNDMRMIIHEYKTYGQCALFVEYNFDRSMVARLKYTPIKRVGINRPEDIMDEIEDYWWCFDWRERVRFTPQLIPAFGKVYEEGETPAKRELLVIRRPSSEPYFSEPDWESVVEYCDWEQKFAHMLLKEIENNFSVKYMVQMYGIQESEEAQREAYRNFKDAFTGPDGESFVLVTDADPASKTEVTPIPTSDLPQHYQFVSDEAERAIIMGHRFYPILLGVEQATGFSNNAEEMNTALKILYRNVINSMREEIIDGLEKALRLNDPNVSLQFKDFPELQADEIAEGDMPDNSVSDITSEDTPTTI